MHPDDIPGNDAVTCSAEHILEKDLSKPLLGPSIGLTGACKLTIYSGLILDHYLQHTGRMLVIVPAQKSPFLTHIVPLASADDLTMHSVLAVSGAHLACRKDFDVGIQALQHYVAAVRGLRSELNDLSTE